MQITLIRHLPTSWNKAGLLQGGQDIPILADTPQERELQILQNKKKIAHTGPFGIVLASRLKRSQQTAQVYGYENPVIEPLLDELDFGSFEGRPKKDLVTHFAYEWHFHPKSLRLGESVAHLEKRVRLVLDHYARFEHVLIFGHGSWMRALLAICTRGDINQMNQIRIENNECIQLSVGGREERKVFQM